MKIHQYIHMGWILSSWCIHAWLNAHAFPTSSQGGLLFHLLLGVLLADRFIIMCLPSTRSLQHHHRKTHLKKMKYWKLKNCKKKGLFLRSGIFVGGGGKEGKLFCGGFFVVWGFCLFLWVSVGWLVWVFYCCFKRQSDQWSRKKLGGNTLKEVTVEKQSCQTGHAFQGDIFHFVLAGGERHTAKHLLRKTARAATRIEQKVIFKYKKISHVFAWKHIQSP